ncbi:hypothetical protein [Amorphus coralli]|uniref:hypothetical protein n=1 Tax=Amorphus coralli TaxID=340680 RepID=UPI0003686A41|nr:hypothetical protein [Amorphus coralli]
MSRRTAVAPVVIVAGLVVSGAAAAQDTASADPWMAIPEPVMIEHLTVSRCEEPLSGPLSHVDPVRGVLSPAATLYAIPCTAGASRPTYRLYVHEIGEIEGVHPIPLAVYTEAYGWQGTALLRGVEWDAEAERLVAEGPRGTDGRIGVGIWSWGDFRLKMERFSLVDDAGTAERIYPPAE